MHPYREYTLTSEASMQSAIYVAQQSERTQKWFGMEVYEHMQKWAFPLLRMHMWLRWCSLSEV